MGTFRKLFPSIPQIWGKGPSPDITLVLADKMGHQNLYSGSYGSGLIHSSSQHQHVLQTSLALREN